MLEFNTFVTQMQKCPFYTPYHCFQPAKTLAPSAEVLPLHWVLLLCS